MTVNNLPKATPPALIDGIPSWAVNANIYEVHVRHYTPEGTLNSFARHLPRLKDMGVDILWLMPVQPTSQLRRKGELGSPYAIGNYHTIHPDLGTIEDFDRLVRKIHEQDMRVILDWVPNHTGWDNPWIQDHPDWYHKGPDGKITEPRNYETWEPYGWSDVAHLDYRNRELRQAMIDALSFWVRERGVDGFRMDVAYHVPLDFWKDCNAQLQNIRPVFMLAEAEISEYLNEGAFISDYAWEMHHLLNAIAKSQGAHLEDFTRLERGNVVPDPGHYHDYKNARNIDAQLASYRARYHRGFKMHFTSNHDENAWSGSEIKRMGRGHQAFAVLATTFDGMPLIFSGQEAAQDKSLEFFKKDLIEWGDFRYHNFYKKLLELKHINRALWNGNAGGPLVKIETGVDEDVFAFTREKNGDMVCVLINLSSRTHQIQIDRPGHDSNFRELFSGEEMPHQTHLNIQLDPWGYKVYSNK